MSQKISRRDFMKAAPAAAGVLAVTIQGAEAEAMPVPAPIHSAIGAEALAAGADYPIRAKRFTEVTMADAFWKPKLATNAAVTIPFESHRKGQRVDGLTNNVLEAAIYSLETRPDADLQSVVETRVQEYKDQMEGRRRGNDGFEVAVAYFNATGKRTLLDPAVAAAAAIYDNFKQNDPPFSGGERDAINCLQLYRATNDPKHLELAKHYLDIRGRSDSVNRSRHNQSYKPVLEQTEAVGHAVNCVTLMLSLVDVGTLTGLRPYFDAGQRMWADTASRKMYVTGGVGATGNEGFGEAYVLPNISAYSETCAVLMFMTLNHRLFLATGDSKYIDVLERGMYNNALSGVATSGDHFFYVNRLASAGDGRDARWQRASLECCPPNLVRFMAQMPSFIYAQNKQGAIYVNLYASSEAKFNVGTKELGLAVDSEMPWEGKSTITMSADSATPATVKLRIPGWARNRPAPGGLYSYANKSTKQATITVNGTSVSAVPDALGYVTLNRTWKSGDTIAVELPFEIRKVVADNRVKEDRGRMAIERGPLVYCVEWPDTESADVFDLKFDAAGPLTAAVDPALNGGATVITTAARSMTNPSASAKEVRLIPYHLWANRGAGKMSVWLSTRDFIPGDVGPSGGRIFYVNPNYARDGWRYLEAAPYDQSTGAKWGCFRHALEGARGTAIGTGKKNTTDILAACTEPDTAAALCANLNVRGVTGWFLPSRDELAQMYTALKATNDVNFGTAGTSDNFSYWASTQETTDMAHHIDFADLGRQHYDDKDYPRRVRAIRAI